MQTQRFVTTEPHPRAAHPIARKRWGEGFTRAVGKMAVYRILAGGFVAHHLDTTAGINVAIRVEKLEELSGFFGYCPRAVSVYETLGVPVRRKEPST